MLSETAIFSYKADNYYNPDSDLLEPVAWDADGFMRIADGDGYTSFILAEEPSSKYSKSYRNRRYEHRMLYLLEDEDFYKEYINQLDSLNNTQTVEKFIIKSDCIVLPSYREGLPRVILESLLLERPVITTNVPGCNRIIKNNFNGILCNSRSDISLKKAMEKFINLTKNKRKKMGINGRKFVENEFNEKKVIDTYFKIIKK